MRSFFLAIMLLQTPWMFAGKTVAWTSPVDLSSPSQEAKSPKVAIDPSGTGIALWEKSDGKHLIIQASTRPLGNNWSAPMDLSEVRHDACEASICASCPKEIMTVWEKSDGKTFSLQVTTGSSQPLTMGQDTHLPKIVANASGDGIIAWEERNAGYTRIRAATRVSGGEWSTPMTLSSEQQNAFEPEVCIDNAGNSVAVWERSDGEDFCIQAAYYKRGEGWSEAVNVSRLGKITNQPKAAVDVAGNVVVVWEEYDGSHERIRAIILPFEGDWSAPTYLSEAKQDACNAQICADPAGNFIVVWEQFDEEHSVISAIHRPFRGEWSLPVRVSGQDDAATLPQVDVDRYGNAIVVWEGNDGSNSLIQAAAFFAENTYWATPSSLSAAGNNARAPRVCSDPEGNVIVVWERYDGAHHVIQAATTSLKNKVTCHCNCGR